MRVVLYSHDTFGMGHFRRNLIIARSLVNAGSADNVLLVNSLGASSAITTMPDNIDCPTLPRLHKQTNDLYFPRTLNMPLQDLLAVRSATILAAVKAFDPDLFIVDNVARGVGGELDDTLQHLTQQHHARCVLGLRDILDDAMTVHKQWHSCNSLETMRDYYDQIWVYGDAFFFNTIQEYNLPEDIAEKLHFTGYFNRNHLNSRPSSRDDPGTPFQTAKNPEKKLVLCMAGGGQDGALLTHTFSRSTLPSDHRAIILTGPDMPTRDKNDLRLALRNKPDWETMEFHLDPVELLKRASAVISMGGYNSISEILSFNKPSFIVPRVIPRKEQQIRAERLKEMQLIELCLPHQLTPEAIETWLHNIDNSWHTGRVPLDFNGTTRVPELASELCRPHNDQPHILASAPPITNSLY